MVDNKGITATSLHRHFKLSKINLAFNKPILGRINRASFTFLVGLSY
jgi:hypothetical protein